MHPCQAYLWSVSYQHWTNTFVIISIVRSHLSSSDYLFQVKSYCGHGIGELFHCAPNIPHYSSMFLAASLISISSYILFPYLLMLVMWYYYKTMPEGHIINWTQGVFVLFNVGNKAVGIMKAGQTFTIEPMINAGKCTYCIAPVNSNAHDVSS
jgi:methionyl aminopeptidase